MIISSNQAATNFSICHTIKGLPLKSKSGFGVFMVKSPILSPLPAANIMTDLINELSLFLENFLMGITLYT